MKRFTATDVLKIHNGKLGLNEDQARRRANMLRPVGGGVYEVRNTVMFKKGEEFGYDGQIPKTVAHCVVEAEQSIPETKMKKPSKPLKTTKDDKADKADGIY